MPQKTAIPIILCGKIPSHQALVPKVLAPEYEVLDHVYPTVDELAENIPRLMASEAKKPRAICMGGGFNVDEFNTAYAIPGINSLPWFRPKYTKPGKEAERAAMPEAPPAEKVAAVVKAKLNEHLETLVNENGAGQIWYY